MSSNHQNKPGTRHLCLRAFQKAKETTVGPIYELGMGLGSWVQTCGAGQQVWVHLGANKLEGAN